MIYYHVYQEAGSRLNTIRSPGKMAERILIDAPPPMLGDVHRGDWIDLTWRDEDVLRHVTGWVTFKRGSRLHVNGWASYTKG